MLPQAERKMRTVAAFVQLARPKFLIGGFVAYALGSAVAAYTGARISLSTYVGGQAMVTAFHLMTHFANDYFDRHADRFTQPSEFAGGSGVLVSGALPARAALIAALACAALGALGALSFARAGNAYAAMLGCVIGAMAWCYSAPPLRLAGRGWGELTTAAIVAVLVPLTGFATPTGTLEPGVLAATIAPACAMFAMMIAVEWPDRDADAQTDKRNLIVRLGPRRAGDLAALGALLIAPLMLLNAALGAPRSLAVYAALIAPLTWGFARRIRACGTAADIAAHGVCVFLLTTLFELLSFLAVLRA